MSRVPAAPDGPGALRATHTARLLARLTTLERRPSAAERDLATAGGRDYRWPPAPWRVFAPGECRTWYFGGLLIAADLYGRRVLEMPGAVSLLASAVDESGAA